MHPLKRKRRAKGMTPAALAERLGITAAAVRKWERGDSIPEDARFPGIAEALGISPDEAVHLFVEAAQLTPAATTT